MGRFQEAYESPETISKIVCVYFSGGVSIDLIIFSSGSLTQKLSIRIGQMDVCT